VSNDVSGELRLQGSLGHHSHKRLGCLAAFKDDHGRDGPHPIFHGDGVIVVDIHLGDGELSVELSGQFFKDWSNGLAGTSPRRPKVHKDRRGGRGDGRLESVGGKVGDFFRHVELAVKE